MKKDLTIILAFIGFGVFGQNVQIDTLNLKKIGHFKHIQTDKMNYPIVKSGNNLIDSLINFDLKNKFTSNEYPSQSIDSTLIKWAGEQLAYLDFKVTYNQNGILSLNIFGEGCGAYCTSWTDYFNYSTKTGKSLDITAIIDTTSKFTKIVINQKNEQYEQQRKELKKRLIDKNSELDEGTYTWALEYYQDCQKSFNIKNFAIYPDYLQIIEDCYLPHAIRSMGPFIELKYKYSEIKEYLKIKI